MTHPIDAVTGALSIVLGALASSEMLLRSDGRNVSITITGVLAGNAAAAEPGIATELEEQGFTSVREASDAGPLDPIEDDGSLVALTHAERVALRAVKGS